MAIRAINDHVAADDRVEAVMLPIADGLTIARSADAQRLRRDVAWRTTLDTTVLA